MSHKHIISALAIAPMLELEMASCNGDLNCQSVITAFRRELRREITLQPHYRIHDIASADGAPGGITDNLPLIITTVGAIIVNDQDMMDQFQKLLEKTLELLLKRDRVQQIEIKIGTTDLKFTDLRESSAEALLAEIVKATPALRQQQAEVLTDEAHLPRILVTMAQPLTESHKR